MDLVIIKKINGHFDWFHPDKKEICYEFYGIPKEIFDKNCSIIVSEEYDLDLEVDLNENYSAINFAQDLLSAIKREYLYHAGINLLELIIQYLEDNKRVQENLMLKKLYEDASKEKEGLTKRISYLDKRIGYLNDLIQEF